MLQISWYTGSTRTVESTVLNYLSGGFPFHWFCFGWIEPPFFIPFQDYRLVWSYSSDLYCKMRIMEEVILPHPFCMWRKKTSLEQLMGIANFILPLVLFKIHVHPSSLTHTFISFLLPCCSYTLMLSSESLFYLWLEFNSPFSFASIAMK